MALKLLLVDDDPAILNLVKTMVEPWGYQILAVDDSRVAAGLLDSEKFDGVVFDILMPAIDGFELARRARASLLNAETPIVMITGLDDVEAMRKCFGLGVTLFLNKPFNYERLRNLFHAAKGPLLQEQRRTARLPFRTTVSCTFGAHDEHHFRAETITIGETGMSLKPSGGLEVGNELTLELTLPLPPSTRETNSTRPRRSIFANPPPPEAGPSRLRGRVVSKVPPDGMGVQFISLTPQDRAALRRFIFGRVTP